MFTGVCLNSPLPTRLLARDDRFQGGSSRPRVHHGLVSSPRQPGDTFSPAALTPRSEASSAAEGSPRGIIFGGSPREGGAAATVASSPHHSAQSEGADDGVEGEHSDKAVTDGTIALPTSPRQTDAAPPMLHEPAAGSQTSLLPPQSRAEVPPQSPTPLELSPSPVRAPRGGAGTSAYARRTLHDTTVYV